MSRLGLPGGGRCLGADLTAYADRTLEAAALLRWDRHVVACACCRAAVEDERRVLAALRAPSGPSVPGDLRGMLLAMGAGLPTASGAPAEASLRTSGRHVVPPVPVAPVRVVDRGTPALHRSARRATVFAGLAAGATAAAAWGLVVTGGSVASPTPPVTPGTVAPVRPVGPAFATAVFTVPGLGTRSTPGRSTQSAPGVGTARFGSAQSTP